MKDKTKTKEAPDLIQDEYPVHHFTMIPHIIDDSDLSPTAYRLYCHLRRVTGEDGMCWKGVRQLAIDCHLSQPTLIKYKYELAKAGLIRIAEGTVGDHPGHHIITICSVWAKNHTIYGGGAKKPLAGVLKTFKHKNTPLKKTPLNNNKNNEQLDILNEVYDFLKENIEAGTNGHNLEEARKLATEYTPEWLFEAMKAAVEAGAPTIGYTKGILKDWAARGFKAPKPSPVRQGRKAIPKIAGAAPHKTHMPLPNESKASLEGFFASKEQMDRTGQCQRKVGND